MKKLLLIITSLLLCFSLSSCAIFNLLSFSSLGFIGSEDEDHIFYFVPEESYFDGCRVDGDSVIFTYAICFCDEYEFDEKILIYAAFDKKELDGWVEYEKMYEGLDENGEPLFATVKAGETSIIKFSFRGKYLGGQLPDTLSFPEEIMIMQEILWEKSDEMKNDLESEKTMELENYLYNKVKPIIEGFDEDSIYALSFFVYANFGNEYKGINSFPEFSVGYNTESVADGAGKFSEERWNFAFWEQNNVPVIDPAEGGEGAEFLLDWYKEQGIDNVGADEDEESAYDESMNYVGKGPVGYYELLCAASNVAKRLQEEGFVEKALGSPVPIIVHELEYPWYVAEATKNANPNGEADDFLIAVGKNFEE